MRVRREECVTMKGPGGSILVDVSTSPDGKYKIAWAIGILPGGKNGKFALIYEDVIKYWGEMTVIGNGRIANNGTFIVSCILDFDGPCYGIVIMDVSQNVILKTVFSSYGGNPGISSDGSYACWGEGYNIVFYDINKKEVVWRRPPEIGGTSFEYDFDVNSKIITCYDDVYGAMDYAFDGRFLDGEKLHQYKLQNGYYDAIREEIAKIAQSTESREKQLIGKSLFEIISEQWKKENCATQRPSYARLLGEMFEAMEMPDKAIQSYQRAISLDPKIGVKRRLAKLQKEATA